MIKLDFFHIFPVNLYFLMYFSAFFSGSLFPLYSIYLTAET